MLRIAIVEDQSQNVEQMCEYIARYAKEHGDDLDVTVYRDGSEILQGYSTGYAIIILDVEMPGINGMDAAKIIREQDEQVVLMFVTNMAQYAIHGYEVQALDFVLKPINYFTFSLRFDRAVKRARERLGGKVALQTCAGTVLLNTADILYLETLNRMLYYHTQDNTFTVRGSLQKAEQELAPYHFARCNQSYLVNLKYVSGIVGDSVQVGEHHLEISRRCKAAFLGAVAAYVGGTV